MSLPAALVITFLTGVAATGLLSPLAKFISLKAGALAHPGDRHVHDTPTPTWGGLAIVLGFVIASLGLGEALNVPQLSPRQLFGLLLGAGLVTAMGTVDDRFHIPARGKLFGQIVCAALLPVFGVKISVLSNPFGGYWSLAPWVSWLLTVGWVVAVTNAINLIDGIDGLAAGVSSICCLALGIIGMLHGQAAVGVLAVALAGAAAGFLPWNFNPAKMFMGDCGAYFLGFMIGGITVLGAFKIAASIAIFVPLLVLAVPLLDTALSALRRSLGRQPVFAADRNHLHHRLLAMGFSQRATAILIYIVAALCCLAAIWISLPKK
jgi:UDP-GlcNAc:undecaprenyl-phosphate/decaprenyl-phosphate GlcNAc-1-phosphate transferase